MPLGPSLTSDNFVPETDAGLSQGLDQRVESSTWMTMRPHLPGSGRRPSGIGRAAQVSGLLTQRVRSSKAKTTNTGPQRSPIEKPGFSVYHSGACSTPLTMYLTVATEHLATPELERRLTARISCVAGEPRPT